MKPILLSSLFHLGNGVQSGALTFNSEQIKFMQGTCASVNEVSRNVLTLFYTNVLEFCTSYELPVSGACCAEILELLKHPALANVERLQGPTTELGKRIHAELKSKKSLFLAPDRTRYYEANALFGEQVNESFPSAIIEIEEAGKCLALERSTACVFHLMRTMEAGLKVLAKAVNIPYAPSWESYLKQIGKIVETPYADKTKKQRREHPFYSEAHAHLSSVKFAWRNPTMHIVNRYTAEEAEEVFNSVRVFMRHLATKLKEGKK